MRAGYSSGAPVSSLTTAHAIGVDRGRVERKLYRGVSTSSGISMFGTGAVTGSSSSSGGIRCGGGLGVTLVCWTGVLLLLVVVGWSVSTLVSCTGSDAFLLLTNWENILLRATIAWYWVLPGAWKGDFCWWPLRADVSASVALVALSSGDAWGAAQS